MMNNSMDISKYSTKHSSHHQQQQQQQQHSHHYENQQQPGSSSSAATAANHHHPHQQQQQHNTSSPRTNRQLLVIRSASEITFVCRHGERIDFTFNKGQTDSWVNRAFDPATGRYKRFNVNMPRSLPARKGGHRNFMLDTPLTEMGYLQAKLTGRALKDAGVQPTHIYVSPALRCVQTSVGLLKGMNKTNLTLNIEPGLFEWGAWFRPQLPTWMTVEELRAAGYPVNPKYTPVFPQFSVSESLDDYYNRSYATTQRIMDKHPSDCCVLLVAHGASLEVCSRQLTGMQPRSQNDFYSILHQTPYLAVAQLLHSNSHGWEVVEPPILPLQHQGNASYNWRLLS